jgi:hypothetical protein
MKTWANTDDFIFFNTDSTTGIQKLIDMEVGFDTVILCESLEHIKKAEFERTWDLIKSELSGLFIVVNWVKNHPLGPDGTGYDHIRLVDDKLYDRLSKDASRVIFRKGSHLVLEF